MNFSSPQENLKIGLSIVSRASSRNVNLPILNNILIKVEDKNIKLISTNLEIGTTHMIRGQVKSSGSFTVDSKTINNYISLLPNKAINIEQIDNELKIKSDNYKTTIKGESAEEFPLIPEVDKENYIEVEIDGFKKALSQVVFAVSNNEARLELSGVFFQFGEKELTLASTDSYRLAEKKIIIKSRTAGASDDKNVIVPSKTIQELLRILSCVKDDVVANKELKIYINDNQVLFEVDSTELVSRLIEGQYPDYKQIIPSKSKTKAVVDKSELTRAIKASSIFSRNGVDDINLDFPENKNTVVVSATSGNVGENITELEGNVSGDDNSVVVNYNYLLDGLNNINTEKVLIEVLDNNNPCVLKPENNKNYLYIIMPIKQ